MGKTLVAIELASRLHASYGDSRWMIDLSTLSDEREVPAVIAGSIRIQPRVGMDPLDSVVAFLRTRRALLVIDNCEHLAWAVAHALASLLRSCPDVTAIATSRTALHVDGEAEWPLSPLTVPDRPDEADDRRRSALDLLLRRAPPSFKCTDRNADDLVSLCRSLGGLPLAIELAASRLGAMTPAEILGELNHRLDVLDQPGHLRSPRQSTLSDAIEWSVDLVSAGAAALLSRLGVMAGWFTADDAAAVATEPSHRVPALLTELVSQSLVIADTSGSRTRYRLLETIRQFASQGLAADGPAARNAHAARFASVAEDAALRLRGSQEAAAVSELAVAHDNLRAAIAWSLENGDVDTAARIVASLPDWAYFRGHYELAEWSNRIVSACGPTHPMWFAVCGAAARGAWVLSRFDEALRHGENAGNGGNTGNAGNAGNAGNGGNGGNGEAPTLARCGHPGDVVADVALYRSDTEAAMAHYSRHRELAAAAGDLIRLTWATYYLSVVAAVTRRWDDSALWAREALEAARASANPTAISQALYANGLAVKHLDPEGAAAMFDEAIRVADTVGNEWFGGIARMERAATHSAHGHLVAALTEFADVIDRWSRAGDLTQLRLTWRYLVSALIAAGRSEDAAVLAGALLADRRSVITHPGLEVQNRLAGALSGPLYNRLLVRGSVLQVWEAVKLSIDAIAAAQAALDG